MGRLTDSLNEAGDELDAIEAGIERMNTLGKALFDNTAEIAQSALKVGYMTGQQAIEDAEYEAGEAGEVGEVAALPAIEAFQQERTELRKRISSLQIANDVYRIQRDLVKQYLKHANIDAEILAQVEKIYQHRGIRTAPSFAEQFLDLDRSQILKLLRHAATYSKHLLNELNERDEY